MSTSTPPEDRVVIVHSKRRVYDGFFKIDEAELSHSRLGGEGMIEHVKRLVFERGDSAAALIHDTERDVIVLTEQFRFPAFDKGPGWLIEPIAGSIEVNETPDACIRREMMEEVGYEADTLEFIARFYVSPGGTSERIIVYYAPVTPANLKDPNASGLLAQQEDVGRVEVKVDDFLKNIDNGVYEDGKLLVAGLWLRNRLKR